MKRASRSWQRRLLSLAGLAALAACTTTPGSNPVVESARNAVNQVAGDSLVLRQAPGELQQAQEALGRADWAWQHGSDDDVVYHWAYMARQRAAITRQAADLRDMEQRIQQAEVERRRAVTAVPAPEELARPPAAEPAAGAPQVASAPPDRLVATPTGRGVVATLDDSMFAPNGADLQPRAEAELDRIAETLKQDRDRAVRIEGYSDDSGSRSRDLELSGKRAVEVRNALIERGIDPQRLTAHGLGAAVPVASNETTLGRQRNRRVEVVLASPIAAQAPGRTGTAE